MAQSSAMGLVLWTLAGVQAWHFGALHPAEKPLAFTLAIAPFVVLFVVIAIRRRRDDAGDDS